MKLTRQILIGTLVAVSSLTAYAWEFTSPDMSAPQICRTDMMKVSSWGVPEAAKKVKKTPACVDNPPGEETPLAVSAIGFSSLGQLYLDGLASAIRVDGTRVFDT